MLKKYTKKFFLILVVLQIMTLLSLAWDWERTVSLGKEYKFQLKPTTIAISRDDYFYFSFKEDHGVFEDELKNLSTYSDAYALLTKDTSGYAKIIKIVKNKPNDVDYVKVNISYISDGIAYLRFPFNKYKVSSLGSEPKHVDPANKRTDGYATVKIKDGNVVISGIYFDNKPMSEFL